MFPLISLFVTRLLFWREKGSKLKVGRESTLTSTARDRLTNVPIMMIVEAQDPTSMGNSISTTTTTVMTTSITVVMTMTSTRITRVDIRATTVVMEVSVEASLSRRTLISQVECFKCKKMGHY